MNSTSPGVRGSCGTGARRCCMKNHCGWGGRGPSLLVTLRRSHTTGMQSKVHPTYKTQYRVANWPAYHQALVRRGDVTVWVSSAAIAAWTARRSGRRGGPADPALCKKWIGPYLPVRVSIEGAYKG